MAKECTAGMDEMFKSTKYKDYLLTTHILSLLDKYIPFLFTYVNLVLLILYYLTIIYSIEADQFPSLIMKESSTDVIFTNNAFVYFK